MGINFPSDSWLHVITAEGGKEERAGAAFGHTLHVQVGHDTQKNREASAGSLEGELVLKITFSFSNQ